MFESLRTQKLSRKLLLLTMGFVMLAELLIFIPSAAVFRQDWLVERSQQAGLLAQALTGVTDYDGGDMLSQHFMDATDAVMMSTKRDGMTELVLGMPPESSEFELVDLRNLKRLPRFRDAFRSFFGNPEGYLRVVSESPVEGQSTLEMIIPKGKLQWAMRDFFERVAWLSLIIAIITAALIYCAMLVLIIRPIENLAKDLAEFRKAPEVRRNASPPGQRKDEIGQLQHEFYDMKQSVRASFKQKERLATLGLAMAKINHDLRNVLTSALLVSDRISMNKDERVANMGERLARAIDRGVKLTAEVLNYSQSKEEPPKLSNVALAPLIDEAARDTLEGFGTGQRQITFKNSIAADLSIRADSDHTYRIFSNLFRNAGQAMASLRDDFAVRELSVYTDIERQDKETVFVNIYVQDTAEGLSKRAEANLFQAFKASTGHGNTGLGLTISKELAEAQGGALVLERTSLEGTVFKVTLKQG